MFNLKMRTYQAVVFLLVVCFPCCWSARSLVGIPPQYRSTLRRTWIFPENETRGDSVTFTEELESCEYGTRKKPGFCLKLTECPVLLGDVTKLKARPPVCYYEGTEPIICCPNTAENGHTNTIQEKHSTIGCGKRPIALSGRSAQNPLIAGGRDAAPYSWPWMVAIFLKRGDKFRYHCGGALVNEQHIVTAAHCFAGNSRSSNPADYAVRLEVHDRSNGTLHFLKSITIHGQYNAAQHYNDIAILKIREAVELKRTLQPVCLPKKGSIPSNGSPAIVTGWGDTSFGGRDSRILQEAGVTIFPNAQCNTSYTTLSASSFPKGITSNMVCAGAKNGGIDACQGDSGGPLVYIEDENWTLLGVVSFGYGCAQKGYPGVYTRITSFLDWIASKT